MSTDARMSTASHHLSSISADTCVVATALHGACTSFSQEFMQFVQQQLALHPTALSFEGTSFDKEASTSCITLWRP